MSVRNILPYWGVFLTMMSYAQNMEDILSNEALNIYYSVKNEKNTAQNFCLKNILDRNFCDLEKFILLYEFAKKSLDETPAITEDVFRKIESLQPDLFQKEWPQLFNSYILLRARHAIHVRAPATCLRFLNHAGLRIKNDQKQDADIYRDFRAMELRAAAYFQLKEIEKATSIVKRLLWYTDNFPYLAGFRYTTYLNYAAILSESGKFTHSNEIYSFILKTHRSQKMLTYDELSDIYCYKIINHIRMNNYETAENILDSIPQETDVDLSGTILKIVNVYLERNEYRRAENILKNYHARLSAETADNYTAYLNWKIVGAKLAEGTNDIRGYLNIINSVPEIPKNRCANLKSTAILEIKFLKLKADFYRYLITRDCPTLKTVQLDLTVLIGSLIRQSNALAIPEDIETISNLSEPVFTFFFETMLVSEDTCCPADLNLAFWIMELYKSNMHHKREVAFHSIHQTNVYDYSSEKAENTLDSLKKIIPSDSHVLLYFYSGKKSAYALILSKDELRLAVIPNISDIINRSKELMSFSENFSLAKYLDNELWQSEEKLKFQTLSANIYKDFIEPLRLSKYKNWNISPDKGLYSIPVDLLISFPISSIDSWQELNFLIKSVSINYFHSAEQFLYRSLKNYNPNSILSIREKNAALPEGDISVNILNREIDFFKTKFNVSERANDFYLSKDELWKEFKNFKYIHLAMHSRPDENGNVSLAFKNFRLTFEDIIQEEIDCDMIVMGTCNSGSGKEFKGYGITSLLRAFQSAGAQNIIAMSWEAEDASTAFILEKFYYYLGHEWDKPNAMRRAKLDFLYTAGKIKSHPFFWGAGEVYADFNHAQFRLSGTQKIKAWCFFAIPVFLLCILLGIKKRVTSTFDMTRPNKL